MSGAAKRRLFRKEVNTTDDDDATTPPAMKSKKREAEPVPPPEVIELRQKVIELEQKLAKSEKEREGAIRITGEGQARIQFLENLVDNKDGIVADAKNKEREDELKNNVSELTGQLEKERTERVKDQQRITGLSNELLKERIARMKGNQRINDLTSKLAKYEGLPQPPLMLHLEQIMTAVQQLQQNPVAIYQLQQLHQSQPSLMQQLQLVPTVTAPPKIHEHGDPINILQMCRPDTPGSIPVDSAHKQMLDTIYACKDRSKILSSLANLLRAGSHMYELDCEVCQRTEITQQVVIGHFLQKSHVSKVRAAGGAVSLAAFQHWFPLLQQASAAVAADAAPLAAQPTQQHAAQPSDAGAPAAAPTAQPTQQLAAQPSDAAAPATPALSVADTASSVSGTKEIEKRDEVNVPTPKVHDSCHPTNLLQMCRPDTPQSISLDSAVSQMQARVNETGKKKVQKLLESRFKWRMWMTIECEACQKHPHQLHAIDHFLSTEHMDKVRSHGAAVSLAAFQHWHDLAKPTVLDVLVLDD